jgi:hypothetical protein
MKKSTKNNIRNAAIGTGIAAAVVGAAAYALKDSPKVKKVTEAMKKEIIREAKKVKAVSKVAYDKVAKQVMAKYKKATHADVWELVDMGKEAKQSWDQFKVLASGIAKEAKKVVKQVKKDIKKTKKA